MKILAALSRLPWPLEKGDKLRAYYQLKGLAERHDVHLICLSDEPVTEEAMHQLSFCASIVVIPHGKMKAGTNLLGTLVNGQPFQVNYFRSRKMEAAIRTCILEEKIDVCFVQLIRLSMNLPFDLPVGWFLDYMDAFSIGMEKRVALSSALMRPFVRWEAQKLRNCEAAMAEKFHGLSIISERDAEALPAAVQPRVHIIPNGVGETFFADLPAPAAQDFDLIFFGNMGYHPNVESARYLMDEIVPEMEKRGLNARICLAGARPAPAIRAYASPTVEVTGFVDDIRTYVLRSRLAIAPLIAGQGLQNKLLESMAMGVPTLTTSLANSALHAQHGQDIIVCDTPADFAREIEMLLGDPERAAALGAAGKAFVETHFRWTAMNQKLENALRACAAAAAQKDS